MVVSVLQSFWNLVGISAALMPICSLNFIPILLFDTQYCSSLSFQDLIIVLKRHLVGYWNRASLFRLQTKIHLLQCFLLWWMPRQLSNIRSHIHCHFLLPIDILHVYIIFDEIIIHICYPYDIVSVAFAYVLLLSNMFTLCMLWRCTNNNQGSILQRVHELKSEILPKLALL